MINSCHIFLFRNAFMSAKANYSFGLIIYLNPTKQEMKVLAQLNGRAEGLVNDPQHRKLYWINRITYATYVCLTGISYNHGQNI